MQDIIDGLLILRKYGDNDFAAEHDKIWAGPSNASEVVSPDDVLELEGMGWIIDEEHDCFCTFC